MTRRELRRARRAAERDHRDYLLALTVGALIGLVHVVRGLVLAVRRLEEWAAT